MHTEEIRFDFNKYFVCLIFLEVIIEEPKYKKMMFKNRSIMKMKQRVGRNFRIFMRNILFPILLLLHVID
jgi:hypothetical protein